MRSSGLLLNPGAFALYSSNRLLSSTQLRRMFAFADERWRPDLQAQRDRLYASQRKCTSCVDVKLSLSSKLSTPAGPGRAVSRSKSANSSIVANCVHRRARCRRDGILSETCRLASVAARPDARS